MSPARIIMAPEGPAEEICFEEAGDRKVAAEILTREDTEWLRLPGFGERKFSVLRARRWLRTKIRRNP